VQREAGHEHISTTLGYGKEVHNRRGRYGEPFPTLPADLVGAGVHPVSASKSASKGAPAIVHTTGIVKDSESGKRDRRGPFFRAEFHERIAQTSGTRLKHVTCQNAKERR
jgi:hypothetical protein